jgi:hypothetical protein
MRAIIVLFLVASTTAHADDKSDGSALLAAGTATTAFAGAEVVTGTALLLAALRNDCGWLPCYGPSVPAGFVLLGASVATAAVGIPMMAVGIKRQNDARRLRVSIAPSPQGGLAQISGSF